MEGIYDGAACDDCFVCGLLYVDRYDGDCPRCHNRMRYHAAVQMDAPTLEKNIRSARIRYHESGAEDRRQRLIELLTLLHRFGPAALRAYESEGGSIDSLRGEWEAA